MNRVARKVKEKYPDVMIITYNYCTDGEIPKCGLDDNVGLVYCAPHEDMTKATIQSSDGPRGSKEAEKNRKVDGIHTQYPLLSVLGRISCCRIL